MCKYGSVDAMIEAPADAQLPARKRETHDRAFAHAGTGHQAGHMQGRPDQALWQAVGLSADFRHFWLGPKRMSLVEMERFVTVSGEGGLFTSTVKAHHLHAISPAS